MLLKIEGLLSTAEVARIREVLGKMQFVDGRATAGDAVRDVKRNLQITEQNKELDECRQLITAALLKVEAFNLRVLPRRMLPVMFNRYDVGMEYGSHVDNAIMGGIDPVRADMSVTVCLSNPDEYEGGGLVINSDTESRPPFRPAAGTAVVYNSTTIHRVEPVTRGSRLAAITWVQSFVRDEARREMLLELSELARWARSVATGSTEAMKISKVRANLMRMWAEL